MAAAAAGVDSAQQSRAGRKAKARRDQGEGDARRAHRATYRRSSLLI